MAVAGTQKTLTVDANVVKYYFLFISRHPLPQGLRVQRLKDFCVSIVEKYPIAINKFIRTEYEECVNLEFIKTWLAKRLQKNLAVYVDCVSQPSNVRACLRNDYGFDCRSMDARYLETCLNTIFKHLVTENTQHFHRPHRSRGRRPMNAFLQHELRLFVSTIDGCCSLLLEG